MTNSFPFYKSPLDSNSDPSDIMTVAEVAAFLGVGKNRIYELLNEGTIKGFRMGRTWKISKLALEKYIREASGL
ncbi:MULTISPECIES: helix-turn-helix domain-containing protein [unclassified Blautia]|uniref:helix-turn-helix domain-containing protein n=1 Tax=unclassified Blautia TaxID=2648079 RepID=UPI002A289F50|nr:helix-turn-helix domain-containing protein [bacterium]